MKFNHCSIAITKDGRKLLLRERVSVDHTYIGYNCSEMYVIGTTDGVNSRIDFIAENDVIHKHDVDVEIGGVDLHRELDSIISSLNIITSRFLIENSNIVTHDTNTETPENMKDDLGVISDTTVFPSYKFLYCVDPTRVEFYTQSNIAAIAELIESSPLTSKNPHISDEFIRICKTNKKTITQMYKKLEANCVIQPNKLSEVFAECLDEVMFERVVTKEDW